MENDRLLSFIKKCNKNWHKPDLHSFMIYFEGGFAFVDCEGFRTSVRVYRNTIDDTVFEKDFYGTAEEAAELLHDLGADMSTIDM